MALSVRLTVVVLVAAAVAAIAPTASWSQAAEPAPPGLAAAIDRVTAKPIYRHASFGFVVRDLATGRVLFERNGDQLFVTGSILKSFAAAGALNGLGPNYRFRTPVFRTGRKRGGRLHGNLVLVASGDMSMGLRERRGGRLFYNDAPNFDHTYANSGLHTVPVAGDPLAGLRELAREVRRSGIRRVDGDAAIDDRLFETFSGWPDVAVSPVSPIVINDNRIDITSIPRRPGRSARVRWRPRTAAYRVVGAPRTVRAGGETDITVSLARPGVFRVSGTIAADAGPTLRVGEIPDPAAFARTAFIQQLRRAGVRVDAKTTGANPVRLLPGRGAYPRRRRVALHVSAKLRQFTRVVLRTSHNPGADLMACLNAVAVHSRDCQDGLVAETRYAVGLGVDPGSVFIFDGAGSDERDHVTPAAMTSFYRAIWRARPHGRPPRPARNISTAFRDSLAVLGRNGDLATSERNSPAAGHISAKTGTRVNPTPAQTLILTARTFIGYAQARSGRQILVAVFAGGVPLTSVEAIFDIAADGEAIAAAMQQSY